MGRRTATMKRVVPGEDFGKPGITRWTEQLDVNDSTSTVLAQGAPTPVTGVLPFRQSDIVFGWKWYESHAASFTANTDTVQTSQYFPYNIGQLFTLNITNLYNMVDVQSLEDLAIFNFIRPVFSSDRRGASGLKTNPLSFPYNPQTNSVSASGLTIGSTSLPLEFDIPACIWLDEYIDLTQNGDYNGTAHRVPVSPLYMSGTARDITPNLTYAALAGANTDVSPFVVTTVGGGAHFTATDTVTRRYQRVGMYGTKNPKEMPVVFNWRYAISSKRFGLGAVSQIDIPIKQVVPNGGGGQLLMVFFRFYDPAAGTGASGLPLAVTNVSNATLFYGSSLIRYQDTPTMMQDRIMDQHDILLPNGVWAWDMAIDDNRRRTNAKALNLYTTDVWAHFNFTGTLSSSAYVVVGCEILTYVLDQPVLN
jgi:hypothetical protein